MGFAYAQPIFQAALRRTTMPTDWAEKVKRVIDRAEDEKYLEVIDDVVAGHLSAVAIKAKHRDPDLVSRH
jgi:hypothetical protein